MQKLLPVFLINLYFFSFPAIAQTSLIDSLSAVVQKLPDDTSKFNPMYALCRQLVISGQYEKAMQKIDDLQSLVDRVSKNYGSSNKIIRDRQLSETARILNLKGVIYNRKADYKEALKYYLEALEIREKMQDVQGMAMTCNNISGLYSNLGEEENELKYMQLAVKNFEAVNDKKGLSQALYNQSLFYYRHADFEKAIETNLKAQKFAEEAGDKISIMHCLLHTGIVYRDMADYDKSTSCYLQALALANETNDKVGLGYAFSNLGINYKDKGDYVKALNYHNKYLEIETELNDKKNIANAYENLSFLYADFRKEKLDKKDTVGAAAFLDSAFSFALNAKQLYENTGVKDVLANTLLQCGILSIYKKNYNEAHDYLANAEKLSEESGNKKHRMHVYLYFSELYAAKNEPSEALKYHKLYSALRDSILNETNTKAINELNTRYETDKKNKQISLLEKQQLIDQMQLRLKQEQIQQQLLSEREKSQQLTLVTKDNEIKNMEVRQQGTELQKQKIETEKNKNTVMLMQKESQLQKANLQKASLVQKFAICGITLLIIFLIYTYWRYQQRKILSNRLAKSLNDLKETQGQLIETEKQREQERIRLRISRDIHDEIGSNLTKIALLSEISSSEAKLNGNETEHSLKKIAEYARSVNSSLSEIIWSVNPKQDTLENLVSYIRHYTHSFLQDTGINFNIDFPAQTEPRQLNPDFKRTIFLILKESLNNCVKHSKAKNVELKLQIANDHFEFAIKDDGSGFDVNNKSAMGNGLYNMDYRIKQFNGSFKIFSSPQKGCEINVTGKLV